MEKYYIQMFSPHGLIRSINPEIGRDKDTGGQVKYVLELLDALSKHEKVRKVDLFTRRIIDKRVSPTYANEMEVVNEKARIIRIGCGGNLYRSKESLWEYLDAFVDQTIRFIEKENDIPDVINGHYADGNYLAHQISRVFGVPFLATGHSLGRNKKKILLSQGLSNAKINELFSMDTRIKAEEVILQKANMIIASTQDEIDTHYNLYNAFEGARFTVIPPGVNTDIFYPFYRIDRPSFELSIEQEQALYRVNSEIERFLFDPGKPLILSIGRPDKRKNFETIIRAYGLDKELQTMANLAIFAGVRKDISMMEEGEREILTNLLLLLDKYDLYGKLAIPKKNDPKLDIPEIYRSAARKKGVFVNATPGENFGLTIVEASASGLPVIASPTGGPKTILENCENGLLIDVEDPQQLANAMKKVISDSTLWENFSANGIKGINEHYSWGAYTTQYLQLIEKTLEETKSEHTTYSSRSGFGKQLTKAKYFLVSDLDGTLLDGENVEGLSELKGWIESNRSLLAFGIATGRNRHLVQQALSKYDLPEPDILICSAGSEIYYTSKFLEDPGWESHIAYQWKREKLQSTLASFPKIRLQEEAAQWDYKLSYYVAEDFTDDDLANLHKFLDDHSLRCNVLLTENKFLDFLPYRASKGNAIKYLSYKWNTPLEQFITAGNGGNDIDMLKGKTKGIVVANYSPELNALKRKRNIYFSKQPIAKGVLEGILHYKIAMD